MDAVGAEPRELQRQRLAPRGRKRLLGCHPEDGRVMRVVGEVNAAGFTKVALVSEGTGQETRSEQGRPNDE